MNFEIRNAKIVTARGNEAVNDYVLETFTANIHISNGCIVAIDEQIRGVDFFDASGLIALPGFVDPHTHIPFVGERSKEFIMRSKGIKYADILKAGGGIHSTVDDVRRASVDDLVNAGLKYLGWMLKNGVTSAECKSGYGLDFENEIKQLEAIKIISTLTSQNIVSTFLGAHAIPPKGEKAFFEDLKAMMKEIKEKNLAEFVDVFCDEGAFSVDFSREYLNFAKSLGFKLKAHADELTNNGFAKIASMLGATSVDHLAMCDESEINEMSKNKTIAVLLPLTSFYLKNKFAPAAKIINSGVPVALGSDFNPGSNTFYSPFLTIHLAVNYMGMTTAQAIVAHTLNAACAIGLGERVGSIEPGKRADILLLDVPSIDYIPYMPTNEIIRAIFLNGEFFENRNSLSGKNKK
ncbi:imidazolonepropionase [Athalassotoga saccharophila]|uniref:imidazolonepropionase n=1 Tax=Athalassotoga saccharophila TaxID=1441386 RepID=UPI001379BF09|nr:imidazolonepropionase [Athalassotoga saccharophila]BBJ28399.1 imidazolonepropionase [Athalassotoga saccharophila]